MKKTNEIKDLSPNKLMSSEDSQLFMTMLLDKSNSFKKVIRSHSELDDLLGAQKLLKLLKTKADHDLTLGSAVMLEICIDDENDVSIYANYICHKLTKSTLIDMNVLAEDLFPWGFISDDQKKEIMSMIKK
ncbi:hypothetical protein [Carboxylicivirga sp. N1Y90]|uniref:hypothetical protein n=1 Tax=Carboxylicivirga fragile TaxID=3417571 RepID=UPI003D3330A6|nr:hypothetical protein [Marinilabiliaceae bacterium N1Y90]